ncbi:PRC-barrel domain-containing protein [Aquamicrobium soli]|jgi:hypothetical protein|uniref:PRC-barrel domain-containing protein n=1 Tax=Aquamicrobium soli TaxID=1811518 RepID=A0ABV7K3K0_9HYPH
MKKVLIALGIASLIASPAVAQTATTPETNTQKPATTTDTQAPAEAPAATTTSTETFVTAQPTDVLSSNLVGLNITNANDEDVGEIKDIVISGDKLAGYIVSVGGFLGMGERYVVVAPSAIQITYAENDKKWAAKMETTKDQLKAAPEFKYEGRWAK